MQDGMTKQGRQCDGEQDHNHEADEEKRGQGRRVHAVDSRSLLSFTHRTPKWAATALTAWARHSKMPMPMEEIESAKPMETQASVEE